MGRQPSTGSSDQPCLIAQLRHFLAAGIAPTGEKFSTTDGRLFAAWTEDHDTPWPGGKVNSTSAQHLHSAAVEDSRAALTEFVKEARIAFPVALDLNNTVKCGYRIFGPPATFFIAGQRIIRDIVLGPIGAERLREAVKKLGIAC